jgi:hypothetical protein
MSHCWSSFVLTALILWFVAPVWPDTAASEKKKNSERIPLKLSDESDGDRQGWRVAEFPGTPPNKVSSDKDGLHIKVQCSSSLLAYCLEKETEVHGIVVRGSVSGLPRIPRGRKQGDEKADDFAMRIGLVVAGTRKLSKTEKLFASELVKRLYELVAGHDGIDHVLFLDLANDPGPNWRKRVHPIGNGLLREQIACTRKDAGDFRLEVKFEKPLTVFALCICCDGDDTKSKYQMTIKDIQLNPKKKEVCTEAKP